jgi:uncharacterized membrane protein YjjP (DUF1212 family)
LTAVAGGASAYVVCHLLGGLLTEALLSFVAGAAVQLLTKYFLTGDNRRYLGDFLGSSLVGLYAIWCSSVFPQADAARIIVSGIIGLLPGLVLVNAVHELAQKNLLSGAAKTFEAMVISATLAFGIILSVGLYLVVT